MIFCGRGGRRDRHALRRRQPAEFRREAPILSRLAGKYGPPIELARMRLPDHTHTGAAMPDWAAAAALVEIR